MMNEEQNIIDATQHGIIDATDELVEVIDHSTKGHADHAAQPFYVHAEFWVAIAFALVVVGLCRPIGRLISSLLHKRIKGIADKIDEAVQIKSDAQKLLADYERKFGNAETEAYQIIERSKREIELIKKEKIDKLERELALKEKEAVNRIERASSKAVEEIAGLSSDLAVETVRKILVKKIGEKTKDELIEKSISALDEAG